MLHPRVSSSSSSSSGLFGQIKAQVIESGIVETFPFLVLLGGLLVEKLLLDQIMNMNMKKESQHEHGNDFGHRAYRVIVMVMAVVIAIMIVIGIDMPKPKDSVIGTSVMVSP